MKYNTFESDDPEIRRKLAAKKIKNIRNKVLPDHPEFVYELIHTIILLRKQIDIEENWAKFQQLVTEHQEWLVTKLNHRWLNSIIDTYADHATGSTQLQAVCISQYYCTLHALELQAAITEPVENPYNIKTSLGWPEYTGKFNGLFSRLKSVTVDEPFVSIWKRLEEELYARDTAWKSIARISRIGFYEEIRRRKDFGQLIDNRDLKVGAELGVAAGSFSLKLLQNSKLQKLYLIDKWNDHHTVEEIQIVRDRLQPFKGRYEIMHMKFNEAVEKFPPQSLEFIYIDAYAGTGQFGVNFHKWVQRLKPGGILAGHDYDPHWPKTIEKIDKIAKRYNKKVHTTHEDRYQSWYMFF